MDFLLKNSNNILSRWGLLWIKGSGGMNFGRTNSPVQPWTTRVPFTSSVRVQRGSRSRRTPETTAKGLFHMSETQCIPLLMPSGIYLNATLQELRVLIAFPRCAQTIYYEVSRTSQHFKELRAESTFKGVRLKQRMTFTTCRKRLKAILISSR